MSAKEAGVLSYIVGADIIREHFKQEREIIKKATGKDDATIFDAGFKTSAQVYWQRLDLIARYPAILAARLTGLAPAWDLSGAVIGDMKDPFTGEELPPEGKKIEQHSKISLAVSRIFASGSIIVEALAGQAFLQQNYLMGPLLAANGLATAYLSKLFFESHEDFQQMQINGKWTDDMWNRNPGNFDYSSYICLKFYEKPYSNSLVRQIIYKNRDLDSLPVFKKAEQNKKFYLPNQQSFIQEHAGQEVLCEALANNPCKRDICPFFIPSSKLQWPDQKSDLCKEYKISFAKQATN